MLQRYLRLARRLPPGVVARRALGLALRTGRSGTEELRDRIAGSYRATDPGPLARLLPPLPLEALRVQRGWLEAAARLFLQHRFDLLGSGWTWVHHGMACPGVEGMVHPPAAPVAADADGAWLAGRINRANLVESRRRWRLIGDPSYAPIDWHLDVKSGFRWPERTWAARVSIGRHPGADIKVPWELARLQHLPLLACAFRLVAAEPERAADAAALAREFRSQSLDFLAANPPRFGVNWRCTMDVAIRAANWLVAYDLFRAAGAAFDPAFETVFRQGILEHGRHIVAHLEWYPEGRGNHYLANVAGLAFVAAWLTATPETDAWLAFAAQELAAETAYQFHPDGSNFEASTCYHRLSAEMVLFAAALLTGLPEERRRRMAAARPEYLRTRPARPLRPSGAWPADDLRARLAGMAAFTRAVTKPDGCAPQIGDNDSGRFLKLHPVWRPRPPAEARALYANLADREKTVDDGDAGAAFLDENDLDHRHLAAGIAALLGDAELAAWAGPGWLDAALVTALAGWTPPASGLAACRDATAVRVAAADAGAVLAACEAEGRLVTEIRIPEAAHAGGDLRSGLTLLGFPDFGLWLFRSERLYLAVRCGPIGQNGRGGHAHNDQLAIELTVDGEDWIADPGTYLYTASRRWRNAYRSVAAHAAPQAPDGREPGRLDLGDFWLGDEAQARCLRFDALGFAGVHHGFGRPVARVVTLAADRLVVSDLGWPWHAAPGPVVCLGRAETAARFGPAVPYSPGYGRRLR